MLLSKLDIRRVHGSIAMALIVLSLFATVAHFAAADAQGGSGTLPVVAVHVSENTESIWPTLLPAHPHTDWAYFAIYESLEEALKSDGTPFVEVNDSLIESGGLLSGGEPKYPILISLAAECISDLAASQILQYVSSGGFAYVGSSAWTRYGNGTARSNFALSAEMGVKCVAAPPNNWNTLTYIYRNGTNQLVDILPMGVNISPWNLPLSNSTSLQNTGGGNAHYFWQAYNTVANPAEILITIPSSPSSYVMLATKNYSSGRFIYHSELVPLVGYGIFSPGMYEYTFFRKAIEWAFETWSLPVIKVSPWPYQYDSAFVIRHDCDSGPGYVLGSAQREKQLGVTGQYYVMTGQVLDDPNNASYITQLQQAQDLYGAEIGPHNGGLNSHYWLSTLPGDYAYYHWGPDICIVRNGTGDYWPYVNNRTDPSAGHSTTGNSTGLYGKDYANMSIKLALDTLESWLGQRPQIWVAPWSDANLDESLQITESLGILAANDRNHGPFPNIALSLNTKGKHYDQLIIPTDMWITSSGGVYQRLEEHSTATMQQMVDYLYSLGALVSIYGHVSSNGGIGESYITYCKSKPNMWNATPLLVRDWWFQRQTANISPEYSPSSKNLTVTITGATSSDLALELKFPIDLNSVLITQVLVDGVPSTDYRVTGYGAIKLKVGTASKVTLAWKEMYCWTQTSQADFESGTLTNLDTTSAPGQVSLVDASSAPVLFSDTFGDPNWTDSNWIIHSGIWNVSAGEYIQSNTSLAYMISYAGNESWSDYVVEARTRYASGQYGAEIAARLNTTSGARYGFWVYPAISGPNVAKLIKFTNWTTWSLVPLATASVATDSNYHTLKMVLNGTLIKCYYDGTLVIQYNDTSSPYLTGAIDLETYAANTCTDWVTVKTGSSIYNSSGTLVSVPFDAGAIVDWARISWSVSTPNGTQAKFRTRTAMTQAELTSASWSDYYTVNPDSITSLSNRWIQYEATLLTNDTSVTPTLYDVTICYTSVLVRLAVEPQTIAKSRIDTGTTFDVNVTVKDVEDLWGFDFNITWDPDLTTLVGIDVNSTLDYVWGQDDWYVAANKTEPGYLKLAALSVAAGFSSSIPTPIAKLTFRVEDPQSNSAKDMQIHFESHKLSDSTSNPIVHNAVDGQYRIEGLTPGLELSPTSVVCRKYDEQFTVKINVSEAIEIQAFRFEIRYNSTLLDYASVEWNAWPGTIAVDDVNGVLVCSSSGSPISGNWTLATITYTAAYYHIWKVEASVPGWKNDLTGTIYFQSANLSYAGTPDLTYAKEGLKQINVGPDVNYTFSPIQGDADNDGNVNIFDLRAVAYYYDAVPSDPSWPQASAYDLNGDNTIDILDLVLVARKYGFTYP